jgi:type VI secretion system protein VasG
MTDISRVSLFGKLDPLAFKAVESAATFCKLRGNPYVEIEHWIHQILQQPSSDLHLIARAFDLNAATLARDVTDALDRLPRGAASVSDLSARVEDATERAWVWATLKFGATSIRTGHLIVAMLKTRELKNALLAVSREFAKVRIDELADEFPRLLARSPEESSATTDGGGSTEHGSADAPGATPAAAPGKQTALSRFTVDLTTQARRGEIDPVVGRDAEIRQVIDILMRRRQNNPILAGEAGVGKTAIVEGLARRIASGEVPPPLKDVALRALDVGLLQAGASMKGEFEQRLRQIIDEVQSSPRPIVLFIDEVHTLVGAGGPAGTGDAANLLKPALARGTLRTIGATTWAEYKKHIEKDPALTRRFQAVKVDEPSEETAVHMMRSLAAAMEKHHHVQVLDAALEAAVRLSHRYIADRQLPDKAVSLLDTACARVAVGRFAMPAEVEDCQHGIDALRVELAILEREAAVGLAFPERDAGVRKRLEGEIARLETLRAAWTREKALVEQIVELRSRLQATAATVAAGVAAAADARPASASAVAERESDLHRLEDLQRQLEVAQEGRPLLRPEVDATTVASVVADWTGIPVGRMVKDEIDVVLRLAATLGERVIGQDFALEIIARRVQTTRANLENPGKPAGVFLLAGPSGVGKTETALALAEALYGGEQNLITINMSEFQESHTVSTLKGSPPGYVGYGEGGVLTEAVRRKPYSVVLLDEVEKAHPDVHEIFYQVFDKGTMEDGEGRQIDFRNTLIILTTNVGSDLTMALCRDPARAPDGEQLVKALRPPMLECFPAALLGRMVVVPYRPLSDDVLGKIVRLQLERVVERLQLNHGVKLNYAPEVVELICARCTEPESGGRMIEAILANAVLPTISRELLARISTDRPTRSIDLGVLEGEFRFEFEGDTR